jgi:hypothetical protein
LREEVDGVASEVAFRPAPVAVCEDQARMRGQLEISGVAFYGWNSSNQIVPVKPAYPSTAM